MEWNFNSDASRVRGYGGGGGGGDGGSVQPMAAAEGGGAGGGGGGGRGVQLKTTVFSIRFIDLRVTLYTAVVE